MKWTITNIEVSSSSCKHSSELDLGYLVMLLVIILATTVVDCFSLLHCFAAACTGRHYVPAPSRASLSVTRLDAVAILQPLNPKP